MSAASLTIKYKKRLVVAVIALMMCLGLVISPTVSAISIGGPSDCDNNAIINCGAHSTAALKQAYNSSAYVQKVFAYFGISGADMANLASTDVAGRVTKDGKVFVDGQSQAVATNAVTGGRQNIAGSNAVNFQGAVFYARPPSVSFQQASLPAFVSMKNGSFQFAVIASCGNAVRATPTQQPKAAVAPARVVSRQQPQPKPQPQAPTQSQQQQQQQSQQVNINNSNTQTAQTASPPQPVPETVAVAAPAQEVPGKLVNTGPGSTAGLFVASTAIGTLFYRRFILRRLYNP